MSLIYSHIASLPVWLRSILWLGIVFFVAWPILMPLIMRFISFLFFIFQMIIRGLYIVFGWTITTPLHTRFGGVFANINNKFNDFMGVLDAFAEKFKIYFKKHRKYHFISVLIVYFIFISLIAVPDVLNLDEKAKIRTIQTFYVSTEKNIFGEPKPLPPKLGLIPIAKDWVSNVSISPQEPVILTVVNLSAPLGIREEPDMSSEVLGTVALGNKLTFLNNSSVNETTGEVWIFVESSDKIQGWVRQQYTEGLHS